MGRRSKGRRGAKRERRLRSYTFTKDGKEVYLSQHWKDGKWVDGPYKPDEDTQPGTKPYVHSYQTSGYSNYRAFEPWVGIDRGKYPNFWWGLVKLYFGGTWHQDTRFVYNSDKKDEETMKSYYENYGAYD